MNKQILSANADNTNTSSEVYERGTGEKVEEDGRFFAYYKDDEFKEKLEKNNFEVVESKIRPMSERTVWLIYFVRIIK